LLPDFTPLQWLLAALAATGIGVSKSGLPGISLLHVVIFAQLFPGQASTGVVLPMLICGDIGAVLLFRRNAQWPHVFRTLPPAVIGVALGWAIMRWAQQAQVPAAKFNPVIGGIVLTLAVVQLGRNWKPNLFASVPHTHAFAWTMGLIAGTTTMLANAAGPVMGLYLLAVALPKEAFVGTGAWFFLLINCIKVPFSAQLGLISGNSLAFNALLVPLIVLGLFLGKLVVARLPQKWFDTLILVFALFASAKLLGAF
jgi:uncharacterized membrane protein YfcA